jgi:hypothetical protein
VTEKSVENTAEGRAPSRAAPPLAIRHLLISSTADADREESSGGSRIYVIDNSP